MRLALLCWKARLRASLQMWKKKVNGLQISSPLSVAEVQERSLLHEETQILIKLLISLETFI